jgi:hypothetical protein
LELSIFKSRGIPQMTRRADVLSLAMLLFVVTAIGLMIAYLVSRHGEQSEHGRLLFGSPSYARAADDIIYSASGASANDEAPDRMPLYVGLIVLSKLIGGIYWSYVLIALQGVLVLLCGAMLHRTASRLTSVPWVPALITLAYAAHIGLQLENFALRETVTYEVFIVAFIYFATQKPVTNKSVALMALACVLAFYTRPTGVLMLVPLGLFILFVPSTPLRQRLQILSWAIGAVILCAIPWQVYQSRAQGRFTLSETAVGGWNFFKGNSFAFEAVSPYIDHDQADSYVDQLRDQYRASQVGSHPVTARSEDDYLRALGKADVEADYSRYLRKIILRVAIYLSPLETPLGSSQFEVENGRVVLMRYRGNFVDADENWISFFEQMSFFVVLFAVPLGVLGSLRGIVSAPTIRPIAVASIAIVAIHIATHAMLTAETRYRLPLDPLFLLWAGIAVGHIFARSD